MLETKSYEINNAPATPAQFNQIALDPARSIVVRACAGSGKTWLLTSRIIRLLLDGVSPQHVLAITFTKKAAQEMRDRVAAILQGLADDSDGAVLQQLTERGLSSEQAQAVLPRARALYDEVLGSGQEIPIFTFHAWFYRLLQAAPMGSGVMRDANLLEDASELKAQAWDAFYAQLNQPECEAVRGHFLHLVRELGEFSVNSMFDQALNKATEIQLYQQTCLRNDVSMTDALAQDVFEQTGLLVNGDGGESTVYARWSSQLNAENELDTLIRMLSCGDDKKANRGQQLSQVFDIADPLARFAVFEPFLVADKTRLNGTQFKTDAKQVARAEGQVSKDEYEAAVAQLNQCFAGVQADLADWRAFELHVHAVPCIELLITAYQDIKRRSRQLDFNDIEYQCFQLLNNPNTAAYVQVQLDARYKHLLFDEFQDTNPLQWHIINSWLDAYEHDAVKPCVFVVGDVKQSIYRFRKADARLFDAAEALLKEKYHADVLKTHATRRNSQAVVAWVNAMFGLEASELAETFSPHSTFNHDTGHIACLSLKEATVANEEIEDDSVEANESDDQTESALPPRDWLTEQKERILASERDDESIQLITVINQLVRLYPVRDEATGGYRPARHSDILLLVYTRTHLSGYERLLREAHIPFISSRRGGLLDTLEALDIMAVVQWLMNEDDDLALLHVLRTPIFAVTHDDLEVLLEQRQAMTTAECEPSYWQALNALAFTEVANERLLCAKNLLNDWLRIAPHLPPHDVLDRIYAQGEVLKHYAEVTPLWLGAQVQANLREFLQLALRVNSGRYPSLASYYQALKRWQALDSEGLSEAEPLGLNNAVRIMTVHAAKGLEAPIVMLIDMKTKNARTDTNYWFVDWPINADAPAHVSWVSTKNRVGVWRSEALAADKQRGVQEKWNQCYVAMTRARQLLLVSAAETKLQQEDSDEAGEGDVTAETYNRSNSAKTGLYEYLQIAQAQVEQDFQLPADPTDWQSIFVDWQAQTSGSEDLNIYTENDKVIQNQYVDIELSNEVAEQWHVQDFSFSNQPVDIKETIKEQAAQLGIAWHGALQFATDNWGTSLSAAELVQRFNISLEQAGTVQDWLTDTLQKSEWQQWFNPDLYDEACNEMSVMTTQGTVKRIDRWVRHGDIITVIDYKSDWNEQNVGEYVAQIRQYLGLMGLMYTTRTIKGLLLAANGSELEIGS